MGSVAAVILGALLGYWAGRRHGTQRALLWQALRSCERLIDRREIRAGLEDGEQDPRYVGRTLLGYGQGPKDYRSLVSLRAELRGQLGLDRGRHA